MNREEDGDERRNPSAIGRDPILFRCLEPRACLGNLATIEADVGDDALVDVVFGVRGACRDVGGHGREPHAAATATTQLSAYLPISRTPATAARLPSAANTSGRNGFARDSLTDRGGCVSGRVEREGGRDEDRKRGGGEPRGVEQHQREQQRDARTRPRASLRGEGSAPEAVSQLRADTAEQHQP